MTKYLYISLTWWYKLARWRLVVILNSNKSCTILDSEEKLVLDTDQHTIIHKFHLTFDSDSRS